MARPVSFQQDLIEASNTVGRGSRAGVSIAQRRLSAVKPDRALGGETQLSPSSREVEGTSRARLGVQGGRDTRGPAGVTAEAGLTEVCFFSLV